MILDKESLEIIIDKVTRDSDQSVPDDLQSILAKNAFNKARTIAMEHAGKTLNHFVESIEHSIFIRHKAGFYEKDEKDFHMQKHDMAVALFLSLIISEVYKQWAKKVT